MNHFNNQNIIMIKLKLKYIYIAIISLLIILSFAACAGEKYNLIIEDIEEEGETSLLTVYGNLEVTTFVNSLYLDESHINTRAAYTPDTVPIPSGRYIHMYIYDGSETPLTGMPINFAIFQSTSPGYINPEDASYNIKLEPGTYNIYAISEFNNSSDKTPSFVNSSEKGGELIGLSNDLDYLWWSKEKLVITEDQTTKVQIIFNRISTQIQINLYAEEGYEIAEIGSGGYNMQGPDNSQCTLQLATGVSTTATNRYQENANNMINLNKISDENVFYLDFLPFKPLTDSLLVKIALTIEGGYNTWRDIYIDVPSGGVFEQGYCYTYNVYIGPTRVSNTEVAEIKEVIPYSDFLNK